MHYNELKDLQQTWKGKVCLFGAGLIGSTWSYDVLKEIGFKIDFYCDNNKEENLEVRDGIKTISLNSLYAYKNDVLVFIAVTRKYQHSIQSQLGNNGINNIICIDYMFLQIFIESLLEMDNEQIKERFKCVLDDKEYISSQFEYHTKYKLDWDNPRTYNEKLQWLKLHDRNPAYTQMVDKYAAKEYIAQKIGEEYVIPTLGVYDTFNEIVFEELPDQFVLKCTHDSGSIVICRDKKDFNIVKVKEVLQDKLKRNLYWMGREWPYKNVRPRIIAEMFMKDKATEDLIDYKFYCFHGEPKFLYVSAGLENHATARISFYNLDLSEAVFQRSDFKHFAQLPKVPTHYQEMIDVARKLSEGIPFIRIDLYEINEKVYFSEFTFTPSAGWMPFESYKWDLALGELLDLSRVV